MSSFSSFLRKKLERNTAQNKQKKEIGLVEMTEIKSMKIRDI